MNKNKYAVTDQNDELPPDLSHCRETLNKKIKNAQNLEKKKGKLMYKERKRERGQALFHDLL